MVLKYILVLVFTYQFAMPSGVLTCISSRQCSAISGHPLPERTSLPLLYITRVKLPDKTGPAVGSAYELGEPKVFEVVDTFVVVVVVVVVLGGVAVVVVVVTSVVVVVVAVVVVFPVVAVAQVHGLVAANKISAVNPLLPNGGGASGAPLSVFHKYLFLLLEFCSVLLCIPKQMENTHFGENCVTGTPLG